MPEICTGGSFCRRRPGSGNDGTALWLLAQVWTATATADALERDPHTIGRCAAAFGEGRPTALIFNQSGDSPRPHRGAVGDAEGGGAAVAC